MNYPRTGVTSGSTPKLILLAPVRMAVPSQFSRVECDEFRYQDLLRRMQRLRGSVYLADGAIEESRLQSDGRHVVAADSMAWHLLAVDGEDSVVACARYTQWGPSVPYNSLSVGQSALAQDPVWGRRLRIAVHQKMAEAHAQRRNFVEVGGWAVRPSARFTSVALRIALSTFALARMAGGCIGLTTATVRHCSSEILRRIGGAPLHLRGESIPPYYDPAYRCQMEILRFDSNHLAARFAAWVQSLSDALADAPVLCPQSPTPFAIPHPAVCSAASHTAMQGYPALTVQPFAMDVQ